MGLFIYFSHKCPVKIWGLTSEERIEKVLKGTDIQRITENLDSLHDNDSVLILRGDYLFDDRLIKYLATTPNIVLHLENGPQKSVVAANIPASLALQALAVIEKKADIGTLPGVQVQTPATISIAFQEKLRKFELPFVLPITAAGKQDLESRLFDWSYKGITDLVTKWAWPCPAKWVVRCCVHLHIKPNHVTLIGLLLVISAGICFARGQYGWGLLAGWLMTFLDTVDGKLARVTVTSSKFGHYFDHLIDIIHPPIWYILWGLGLGSDQISGMNISLTTLFYSMMIGYIIGRLIEGSFNWFLGGSFGIFCWQPIDAYFRLITARRNPNMIFLTISFLAGRPDLGLLAVTFWTVTTTIFLLGRLTLAWRARLRTGSLRSWLSEANTPKYEQSLAVRLFARHSSK
ncbi:CDP-alcohol phosphatidyltransferase family protein [Desulfobacter sp.]|uniref:CDP-alcohol phosphatidyltransferase family protein n=1 Tax=Desulfobacter sp. TaxID=2294 RepID=UPI003D13D5E6